MEQEWAAYSFNYPVVFSYVSEKELSSSNIKKFFVFSQKKAVLIFRETETLTKFLIFQETEALKIFHFRK